jgi:hypothetical protein
LPGLQFFVIFVALRMVQAWPLLSTSGLRRVVLWVHLLNGVVFLGAPLPGNRRIDTAYPARELADAVLRDWQGHRCCPLKFVVGPTFEAGLVSVHSGSYAKVLEEGDYGKSPWIDERGLRQDGFVVMTRGDGPALSGDAAPEPAGRRQWPDRLSWFVVPPEAGCN